MVDRWSDRLAKVDQAVDRVMSETVRFFPMVVGSYAAAPDETRAEFELPAVLYTGAGETDLGGNANNTLLSRVVTSRATLEVRKDVWPVGAVIRKNDEVEAIAKGRRYRIESSDQQHPSQFIFHLTIVGETL